MGSHTASEALGIGAESPEPIRAIAKDANEEGRVEADPTKFCEDLQWIARPEGERPYPCSVGNVSKYLVLSASHALAVSDHFVVESVHHGIDHLVGKGVQETVKLVNE